MFNRPWLSTSVREWWSRRWNICFKGMEWSLIYGVFPSSFFDTFSLSLSTHPDQYYKIVFGLIDPRYAPTPRIQQKPTKHRRSSSPAQRQPVPRSALAALVTFLFSGLIHDYYAYVTFGRVVTTESTRFFVLHGLLSTVEVVTKARFPWLRRVPTVICIIYVTIVATVGGRTEAV